MAGFKRKKVTVNGIKFTCLEYGKGDRLALCLHGFPDDAAGFETLLTALADSGYRAVAPYMRGYGPTGPAPDGDYSIPALASDAAELVAELGHESAVLIGHDWGAAATYAAANHAPDTFTKVVAMALPPLSLIPGNLPTRPEQFRRSWYIGFFQLPWLADMRLPRDDFALVERLWNDWSPGWDYPEERMRQVKETFSAEHTPDAALAYYRALWPRTIKGMMRLPRLAQLSYRSINVPGLVIAGENDGCIGRDMFNGYEEAFKAPVRLEVVKDAGHFMHQERPRLVNKLILDFLAE